MHNRHRTRLLCLIVFMAEVVAPADSSRAGQIDDEPECYGGGPGASECSLTAPPAECTVTCGTGYYACCTLPMSCHCEAAK